MSDTNMIDDEMNVFMTAVHHSNPQRMKLYTPTGKETEHYLDIIGVDSKPMRDKKSELLATAATKIKEGGWNKQHEEQFSLSLVAASVVGWSFKKEPTFENVYKFLESSPNVYHAVDVFCQKEENYFGKK